MLGEKIIMDSNTVTLVIGLSGITATLISSALGLYFTSKARSSPLREMLYSKQIDLIVSIISKTGRIRIFTTILASKDSTFKDRARDDLGDYVKILYELTEQGAAILPTELWIEVKKLSEHVVTISDEYDKNKIIDSNQIVKLSAIGTKVALVARSVLGVDELTEESIKIFSSKKAFGNLANIEISYFENMAREKKPNNAIQRT